MITFEDFIKSDTAKRRKIDNRPTDPVIIHNINSTISFLNSLNWKNIVITSGYRCKELNKAVGGVDSSHHLLGYAADITSGNIQGLLSELKERINEIDQLIYYPKRNFIHVSIHPNNRKQYFSK